MCSKDLFHIILDRGE